eukprot:jgi/Chlat1/2489/Chrsp175S02366
MAPAAVAAAGTAVSVSAASASTSSKSAASHASRQRRVQRQRRDVLRSTNIRLASSHAQLAGEAVQWQDQEALAREPCSQHRLVASGTATADSPAAVEPIVQDLKNRKEGILHLYRQPLLSEAASDALIRKAQQKVSQAIEGIETEQCFNVLVTSQLSETQASTLAWLLRETFEPEKLTPYSSIDDGEASIVEVGPRMTFTTAWSANAVSICRSCGLLQITRIERSRRYKLRTATPLTQDELTAFAAMVHDRMTETVYPAPITSFAVDAVPAPVVRVPVMKEGRKALEQVNKTMGLAFDDWDLEVKFYTKMFRDDIKRDPTTVELFDMAQSNSEHSRHWFFKGDLVIDGEKMPHTLLQLVMDTLEANPSNSVIGYKDNSRQGLICSAIRGREVTSILPEKPGHPSALKEHSRDLDILFTAETHNFPCAVAPFPGAETGAGGRIRDTHATGIGSIVVASTAGYCTGNLQLPEQVEPWEDTSFAYPENLASPLQIMIDASNGASDYGNKFGEPLIQGYTRTYGMRLPSGERREWLKPIMFSGGVGQIDHRHLKKADADIGMLVVKIGGPAYRIGMGGGAASSMVSGSNAVELDFNAVQRGDAEMSNKLNRVVRTCVELGDKNPIMSIHDQGAGGNCNVVKEIIDPKGAKIDIRKVVLGDETMSVLEIWGAEYQEQDALLIKPDSEGLLRAICERERLSMAVLGSIDGRGYITLIDSAEEAKAHAAGVSPPPPAVDLELEKVLGKMPNKTFRFMRQQQKRVPLEFPAEATAEEALLRILRLPAVCSKRFLTTKVDRCVTGLVAQQQTVGPLQLPLADVAVIAQSHLGTTGAAISIGEQPINGLLDSSAMARMALGESLTNLVWAKITALKDVKASGNWMYAAKLGGEGAAMYDAAIALKEAMITLGVAIDGGKDSLSMAAQAGGETVMAPGNLVISSYVTCPDITLTVTPDLKLRDNGVLLHIDLAAGRRRLGASSLAQVYQQLGDTSPDMDDVQMFKRAFETMQTLIADRKISAGHDVSDGGLAVALAEMAFAGNCGLRVEVPEATNHADGSGDSVLRTLFAEELGYVLEVSRSNEDAVLTAFREAEVPCSVLGIATSTPVIEISVGGAVVIQEDMPKLRDAWEKTSFELEKLQSEAGCVAAEQQGLQLRQSPIWQVPFTPKATSPSAMASAAKHKVAIIREEGVNGDREMASAFHAAGMEPWDVTMSDLLEGRITLQQFRGVVFAGGFSYADVLDSAKGWAATIKFNDSVLAQFQEFYNRPDTFSLGVCNGCQLMALLGWVPGGRPGEIADVNQPRFVHNASGRFECRFTSVTIQKSPSIMLSGLEGSTLGIWVAHGEGRALFPDERIMSKVLDQGLAPVRYCSDDGQVTENYPFNPNGSPLGIAALCSEDGRHLAIMPHPERCFLMWQFPWAPAEWSFDRKGPSPWLKMFQNAQEWLESH